MSIQVTQQVNKVLVELENSSSTLISIGSPKVAITEIGQQGIPGPPGPAGPQGPQGPPGTGGTGSDVNYVHTQSSAQSTWVVIHNLNKYPSVTIVDSGDSTVIGDVVYDSLNQVTIYFSAAFGGRAFLN